LSPQLILKHQPECSPRPTLRTPRLALFGPLPPAIARYGNTKTVRLESTAPTTTNLGGGYEGPACRSVPGTACRRLSGIGVALDGRKTALDGFGKQVRGSDWQDCPVTRGLLHGHGHGVRGQ